MKNLSYIKGVAKKVIALDEIVETTESDAVPCIGAKAIMLTLVEGGTVLNRSGELTITVSNDGEDFYDYNMLIDNVANSNAEQLTRVASKTRNSAGGDLLFFSKETLGAINYFKVKVTLTDGGTPTGNFTVNATVCK